MERKYFGVMLDMSRNAVMQPEQVKKFAKTISAFGYNMIQLYTEDTYEVENEPYFGYMRGRYTQEEIKDIVAYCNGIGVEVVPCIQTLAHLKQIFKWSPYAGINDTADILLVEEERTYQFIENMFKTLRKCYTTSLIHIGMDEAHLLGLGKYLDKHGYQNRFDIFLRHLEKVVDIAKKYGFEPMIWSDMFFRIANEGKYYGKVPQEVKAKTPKDVKLVYWYYYSKRRRLYRTMLNEHNKFNNEVWFAGGAWSWKGFAPSNRYSLQTMKPAMEACRMCNIENVLITMWGDNGKECSFYSLLPSLFAIRKFYNGETHLRVIKEEFYKLTGEKFDEMMALDIPNQVNGNKKDNNTLSKALLYSDPFNGFIDSVLPEGGYRKEYENYAKRLTRYAKNSQYGYIFNCLSKLCRVIAIKGDLGVRTRKAYETGNKALLQELVTDYKKTERKIKEFYQAFKRLWFEENKPHGFDVQDFRIGGLINRLQACRERLQEYVDGKIDNIPELEEKLLDYYGNGLEYKPDAPYLNNFIQNVTVNVL